MTPCVSCGWLPDIDIQPGILRDLRVLLGPKMRATVHGHRKPLCFYCVLKVARLFGIVA